jgi:hypothetical protein
MAHMSTPYNYPLLYYRSPEFTDTFMRRAEQDYEATFRALYAIVDQLRDVIGSLQKAPPVPLTKYIAGPLTVNHLIALVRVYALQLLRRLM